MKIKKHKHLFHLVAPRQAFKVKNIGPKKYLYLIPEYFGPVYYQFVCEICGKIKYIKEKKK